MKRPPQLDNARWLRQRYLTGGDQLIALELGVDRKTVRAARERHGIESMPPGRRRGVTIIPSVRQAATLQRSQSRAVERILARALDEHQPPTAGHALEIFAAADRARRDHDRTSEKNAWERLAAHCLRIVEHMDTVERAT